MPKVGQIGQGATPTTTVVAPSDRTGRLVALLGKLAVVPDEWLQGVATSSNGQSGGKARLKPVECDSWDVLVNSWRKAMRWTDGLDRALSCMLSSVVSTRSLGDQLWMKIYGPASCGKTTLAEALAVARRFVLAKSTFKGFHSGYVHPPSGEETDEDDDSGEEDMRKPLIERVRDKTFITKDGDTLLQQPNLPQILSEGRDLYDRVSRSDFRNGQGLEAMGVNMTWLLCGTSSLRSLDSSELGERFLDCVIMDTIDDDLEDEILLRVAERAERNVSIESDGSAESQQDPELTKAMQLTGGYVEFLRENAPELLSGVDMGEEAKRLCTRLGKFVAFMRARPSKRQDEECEREFAARLVSQHIRLAKCMAAVLNKTSVDTEVLNRVRRVALDTSRGQTLNIVRLLYKYEDGVGIEAISSKTDRNTEKTRTMLRFLKIIGVVELYTPSPVNGVTQKARWKLKAKQRALYEEVMGLREEDVPF